MISDDVQELYVTLTERDLIQAYVSSFSSVLLADLNVLLTTDMLQLRGSCNARNSWSATL